MAHDCFRIKGSVLTTFIIEFNEYNIERFKQQLNEKIKPNPEFFQQSPVVIDFGKLDLDTCQPNYSEIISICRNQGLQPIAFRQHQNLDIEAIEKSKLAVITHNGIKADNLASDKPVAGEDQPETQSLTRIINKPVRSGQQIYAEGGDLVILGSVGGGAEVLADGNIHIYGTLRGRALAGVKGDKNARIFCSSNEAELVSITGHFLVSDSLESQSWKQPTQFYLTDETLHVDAL